MSRTNATALAEGADNSSTDRKIQHNAADASSSICPLCCEEEISKSPSSAMVLSTCRHRSCRTCLIKWMEREEASGRSAPPPCPFCRTTIGEEDVFEILGRPFRPRRAVSSDPTGGEGEISELTLQWINENTLSCGGCGSHIEKAGGCDLVECLCGYRFCYGCGVAGGECGCNPGHFFDNDTYILDGPVRDGEGQVDLGSCIRRRELRLEREVRREWKGQEESERWQHSERNAGVCASNGRWLFVPAKNAGCILMLTNQLGNKRIRDERELKRRFRELEDYGRWNWVLDPCLGYRRRPFSSTRRRNCQIIGRFLNDESEYHWHLLQWEDHQLGNDVLDHRRWPFSSVWRRDREIVPTFSHFWLYLPQGEDVEALRQHLLGHRYRKKRKFARFFREIRDAVRERTN